jgi:hypothetical protein
MFDDFHLAPLLIESGFAMLANRSLHLSIRAMHNTGKSSKSSTRVLQPIYKDSMPIAIHITLLVAIKSSWKH